MVSALYCYLLPIYAFQMLDAVLRVCHLSLTIIRSKNPSVFTSYHTLQLLYYLIVLCEHCRCIIEYMYCLWYIITFTLGLHQCFSQMGSTLVRHLCHEISCPQHSTRMPGAVFSKPWSKLLSKFGSRMMMPLLFLTNF